MNEELIPAEPGIKVMGARSQHGGVLRVDNLLRAMNTTTFAPVCVFWRYDGESEALYADSFRDSKPDKALIVSSEVIRINPANILPLDNWGSIALIQDDGTGSCYKDEVYQPHALLQPERNHDIVRARGQIYNTAPTFINRQGQLCAARPLPEAITALSDVVDIQYGRDFCVILRANGSLVFWAEETCQVPVPPAAISALTDIAAICQNDDSVVVLRQNGTMMAWGRPNDVTNYGGTIPADILVFTDYVRIWPATNSYVALRKNGQIVSWGDGEENSGFGIGGMPGAIRVLDDIIHVATSGTGCVALRANGQMVGWGCNGDNDPTRSPWIRVPEEYAQLDDIIDVKSAGDQVFVALRENGTLLLWGFINNMLPVPYLSNVTAIATSDQAVAALHPDGTVSTFGYFNDVDNWNKIKHELVNVCAVYSDGGFVAITEDQRVIDWGAYGAKVLEEMTGRISYQKPHLLPNYPG